MNKDLLSAVVMSLIVLLFGIPMQELSGESKIIPEIVLLFMIVINLGQYALTFFYMYKKTNVYIHIYGYPFRKIGCLGALTFLYLFSLEYAGFYAASFVYFVVVSLLAQPMKITTAGVIKRVVICGICIALLYLLFTVSLSVMIPLGIFQ